MAVESIPDKQANLSITELRTIFQAIDSLAAGQMHERDIFQRVAAQHPEYEPRFLRWLVRHTLHPETDDDIMPDEVLECQKRVEKDGITTLHLYLRRIPPTLAPSLLVQYQHTFWHVTMLNAEKGLARLVPLSKYTA